jgi:predicted nucleotidyltransferase
MEASEIRETISDYFRDLSEIHTVILFGSAAEGKLESHSDVDLAVASLGPLKFEDLLKFNTDLQILLKKDIDLIDLNQAKGLIHYKILTKGIRLKNSGRELADHMVRAMDFKTDFLPQLMAMQRRRIEKTAYGT